MMLDKLNKDTEVIVQGLTGKEGQRAAEFMLASGTKVVAGVRPGKAGEKVLGVPVFDSVVDARNAFPDCEVGCIYVPPQFVLGAFKEAVDAGMRILHIIGEGVAVKDTAKMIAIAKEKNVRIIGPSSLGVVIPEEFKLGQLMGVENTSVKPGNVGIVSRSGGMSSEMADMLTKAGIGQSMVVHVGGDFLIGTTPAEVLEFFEGDEKTEKVLMVGEVGGSYESEVVEMIKKKKFTKPLVVFIAGAFVESLPQQVPLGHAGAIIQGEADTREGKIKMFKEVGVEVVGRLNEVTKLMKSN